MAITFGSLFAGIGGIDLGLERAGMRCVWQVEIDPYATRVLEKHWPAVRRWDNVRTFPPAGDWGCDLIAGGFPCQDISLAGKREGINGERSGLWAAFARIVRILRPTYVLVENSDALTVRGLGRVLGDLAVLGFDAEWAVLPATAFGAPHLRPRLFVVAYSQCRGRHGVHDRAQTGDVEADFGNGRPHGTDRAAAEDCGRRPCLRGPVEKAAWWEAEPPLGRVVDGVPDWVAFRRAIGNAVVPQVAEWIGRQLVKVALND